MYTTAMNDGSVFMREAVNCGFVHLQKVVPTFCTKSLPAPPHALTPFTGQQKRRPGVSRPSAWATDPQGRASRSGRPHVARR